MICLFEIILMLYYQNVVLLNAFCRHQIVLFFKGSAICVFTSCLLFNRACYEPEHFTASCFVKIGFKYTIGKKELPEAERKKIIVRLLKLGRYGYRNYLLLARVLQILCPFIHKANNKLSKNRDKTHKPIYYNTKDYDCKLDWYYL